MPLHRRVPKRGFHNPFRVEYEVVNLDTLGAHAEVRRADARAFLRNARAAGRQYDLVLLDPPYQRAGALAEALAGDLVAVLAPRARVVAESDRRSPLELPLPLRDERRYGDTVIRIFQT